MTNSNQQVAKEPSGGLRAIHARLNEFVRWLDLQDRRQLSYAYKEVADKLSPIVNDLDTAIAALQAQPSAEQPTHVFNSGIGFVCIKHGTFHCKDCGEPIFTPRNAYLIAPAVPAQPVEGRGLRELPKHWRKVADELDKPRDSEKLAEESYPRIALTRGAIHLRECADELEAALAAAPRRKGEQGMIAGAHVEAVKRAERFEDQLKKWDEALSWLRKQGHIPDATGEGVAELLVERFDLEATAAPGSTAKEPVPFDNAKPGQVTVNAPTCGKCGKIFLDCTCGR